MQESQVVRLIRRQLIRRSIDMLKDLAKREPEKKDDKESKEAGKLGSEYDTFWEGFGKYIKLGVLEDQDNRCAYCRLSAPDTLLFALSWAAISNICSLQD